MPIETLKPHLDELIEQKDWVSLKKSLNEVPAVDVAELLEELDNRVAAVIFRLLRKAKAADVFSYLSPEKGADLLDLFTAQQLSEVMSNLEPDERVALLEELPGQLSQRVLNSMRFDDRAMVQKLLGYPPESVGRLMTPRYVKVKENWTIGKAMEWVRKFGHSVETVNVIYVVGDDEHLVDDLTLNQLILADPSDTIATLMDHSFEALRTQDDQEEAVAMLSKYDRVAMPVIDSDGILVGIVTVDDVIDVAEEETTEDMQLMAGMDALETYYSQTSIKQMIQKRIGWLVILFLCELVTASVMGKYESFIASAAFLALFIPMILATGGNSGNQAATLIIRALSTDDIDLDDWWKVFSRELATGILMGLLMAVLGFVIIFVYGYLHETTMANHMVTSAFIVGLSLIGVVLWGTISGSMLPFALSKAGFDPAFSSNPFVSTLCDVMGIFIYFSIAVLLLGSIHL